MDNHFYQTGVDHYGFTYQNPSYAKSEYVNPTAEHIQPSIYRHSNHDDARWENFKLATIYVKPQVYKGINSPADAFKQGTAFVELYKPFIGKGGQR